MTRCATSVAAGAASPWAARGYPESDAPAEEKLYGQDHFNRDAIAVLDAAGVDKAHVVGLSMGGYTALMLAAKYPARVKLTERFIVEVDRGSWRSRDARAMPPGKATPGVARK